MSPPAPLGDRLDRLVWLYETAYQTGTPGWRVGLRPPASGTDLNRVEQRLGRLLPEEARDLYQWHNGCDRTFLVPDLSFNPLDRAVSIYQATDRTGIQPVTNGPGSVENVDLFPVFNIDRILFSIRANAKSRATTSPVYVPLIDDLDGVTVVSSSIAALIEHLIVELEAGRVEYTEHGVRWSRDPYPSDPQMEPYRA